MLAWLTRVLLLGTPLFLVACGSDNDPPASSANSITQQAAAANYTAFGAAAAKADLTTTLNDPSANVTVFIPTNAAFDTFASRLGFDSATALVEALPAATLRSVLLYHVVPGTLRASDLQSGGASQPTQYTLDGQPARLALDFGNGVRITDAVLTQAQVTAADTVTRNGMIHEIDKVLVPPGVLNIVQMAQLNPEFSSLVSAVTQADLAGTLSGAGPLTVFAPTNAAFAAAPTGLTVPQLQQVLLYHVVAGRVLAADLPAVGSAVPTAQGQSLTVGAGPTLIDSTGTPATIAATDVIASNGVIHVIGKVLVPVL